MNPYSSDECVPNNGSSLMRSQQIPGECVPNNGCDFANRDDQFDDYIPMRNRVSMMKLMPRTENRDDYIRELMLRD